MLTDKNTLKSKLGHLLDIVVFETLHVFHVLYFGQGNLEMVLRSELNDETAFYLICHLVNDDIIRFTTKCHDFFCNYYTALLPNTDPKDC